MQAQKAHSTAARSGDSSLRSLVLIQKSGSTSRVLNLLAASERALAQGRELEPRMFETAHLNRTIIVKHHLRGHERSLLAPGRSQATKIILPFASRDLSLGGQTILVGQRGWTSVVGEAQVSDLAFIKDVARLELIDSAPSLDPFLLREHLRRYGHTPDLAYFSITPGDVAAMEAYVAEHIAPLIQLAFRAQPHEIKVQTARFASALLSSGVDEALEPFRAALHLPPDMFGESIFCWKGVLYYKWKQGDVRYQIGRMLKEMDTVSISGPRSAELTDQVAKTLRRVRDMLNDLTRQTDAILHRYDATFLDLVERGQPGTFHAFLKAAPHTFMVLGRKLGAAAHVTSYWRYRFPPAQSRVIALEDYAQLLDDFEGDLDTADSAQDESFWL